MTPHDNIGLTKVDQFSESGESAQSLYKGAIRIQFDPLVKNEDFEISSVEIMFLPQLCLWCSHFLCGVLLTIHIIKKIKKNTRVNESSCIHFIAWINFYLIWNVEVIYGRNGIMKYFT